MSEEELSRVYTINLSKVWLTPRIRRTKRAINMIREFAQRHMKSEEVKIDQSLNEVMWERGIRHPPRKIRVKMVKDEDDVVTVSLYSEEVKEEEEEVEEVKEKPKVEVAVPTPAAEVVTEELEKKEEIVQPELKKVEEVIEEKEKPKKIVEEPKEEKKEEKPKKKEKKPELEPETIELSEEELAEMMAGAEGLEIKEEPEKRKDKGKGKKSKEESKE